MTRTGGLPRINRPPAAAKAVARAVETKPEAPPQPVSANSTAMLANPPAPDFDSTDAEEFDEEGRRYITKPLAPLPRPAPTILHPTLASRAAPPPVRQPGTGLLASPIARPRPAFLSPRSPAPPLPPESRAYELKMFEQFLKEARQEWLDRLGKPRRRPYPYDTQSD